MNNLDLSVVIITKNEEKNIKKCIEKVIDFTNEIIILDSKSSDKTSEIVNSFNSDKILFQEVDWQGYGQTKNIGIKMAKNNWILSLDADEVVTEKLKNEIIQIVLKNDLNIDGYYIPRKLFFCNKPVIFGGVYPDYQLRLFRKNKGLFQTILVHESVELKGKKSYLKNYMEHFSYHSMFDYWERFNKYTELDAMKIFKQNKKFHFSKIFSLFFKIFKRLIIKKGIFDGFPGIFYHVFSSMSSFVKYAKLWELENKAENKND